MHQELNPHQLKIIQALMFTTHARYTDLNAENMPTNQFTYHMQHLIDQGYIIKEDAGYTLSLKGKDIAGKIDIFSGNIEKQGKICMMPVCIRKNGDHIEYLVQQRKKQPSFNYIGFPSGKAKFGYQFVDEVIRELQEETGLSGTPVLKQVKHILVRQTKEGEIIQDKLFHIFLITKLKGNFIPQTIEGINFWMSKKEIEKQELLFPDVLETIEAVSKREISFIEHEDIYTM